jgi:hypothetical protein
MPRCCWRGGLGRGAVLAMDSSGGVAAPTAVVCGRGEEQAGGGRAAIEWTTEAAGKALDLPLQHTHADAMALARAMGEPRGSQALKPVGHV